MDRANQALKLSSMYVSQVRFGLLRIYTDTDRLISLFCTLSFIHTRMCTYTYIYSHAFSLLTRRRPHPLQLQLLSSIMQRTGTRTSSLVSDLN